MRIRKTQIVCIGVVLSFLFSTGVMAETTQKTLTVTGNGMLKVSPDIAYLNVGVRTSDKDAETASEANIAAATAIVDSLKKAGIDEKDIKTQYYYVNPIYDYSSLEKGSQNSITGYEVSNSLNITIRNIDDVGKIIDTCISAGANMINGLSYAVETPSAYYDRLFDRAMADASRKSASIAKAIDVKLSAPITVSESGYVNPGQTYVNVNTDMRAGGSSAAFPSTYATPGDIELYANVVVTYSYE